MRKEFSKKTRLLAFQRASGRCECGCGTKLTPGEVQYDHELPAALGGSNDLSNCVVLRTKCHRQKTSEHDVPQISKSARVAEKRMGIRTKRGGFRKAPHGFNTWTKEWDK